MKLIIRNILGPMVIGAGVTIVTHLGPQSFTWWVYDLSILTAWFIVSYIFFPD